MVTHLSQDASLNNRADHPQEIPNNLPGTEKPQKSNLSGFFEFGKF